MKRTHTYALLFLALLRATPLSLAQPTQSPFALTISTQSINAKIGSAVHIGITLKNGSDREYTIEGRPGPEHKYEVLVIDSNGKPAAKTPRYREATDETPGLIHGGSYIIKTLKPGEELHEEIRLAELYDLARPDKYVVQLQFRDSVSRTIIKSNRISVTVVR